jgi:hypothetical protein
MGSSLAGLKKALFESCMFTRGMDSQNYCMMLANELGGVSSLVPKVQACGEHAYHLL